MHRYSILAVMLLIAGTALGQDRSTDGRQGRHRDPARLFQRADANHDGRISAEEWKRNPEAFNRLDQNKDGFITQDEAQSALRRHGERRGKRVEKLFGQMDKNSDGRISRDEWGGAAERFDRLDSNHDGSITHDELSHGRPHGKRRDDSTGNTRPPSQV